MYMHVPYQKSYIYNVHVMMYMHVSLSKIIYVQCTCHDVYACIPIKNHICTKYMSWCICMYPYQKSYMYNVRVMMYMHVSLSKIIYVQFTCHDVYACIPIKNHIMYNVHVMMYMHVSLSKIIYLQCRCHDVYACIPFKNHKFTMYMLWCICMYPYQKSYMYNVHVMMYMHVSLSKIINVQCTCHDVYACIPIKNHICTMYVLWCICMYPYQKSYMYNLHVMMYIICTFT